MGTQLEGKSVEAEIAECCQAIYSASELEVAMMKWARLRELIAQKSQAEDMEFMRDTASLATQAAGERRP